MGIVDFELQFLDILDRFIHLFDNIKIGEYNILIWFWWLITQFGGSIVIVGIIIFIYWCYNKEKGEKIAFAILNSFCINGIVKSLVTRERPFEINDGEYAHVRKMNLSFDHASGSSFPSGHSQNSITTYASLAIHERSRFFFISFIILSVLIPLSRLVLGVHYPSDVIVGGIIGLVIAFFNFIILKYCYKKKFIFYIGMIIIFLPFLFVNNGAEKDLFKGVGLLAGFVLGIFIENKAINFTNETSKKRKLLRLLLGSLIIVSVYITYYFVSASLKNADLILIDKYVALCFHFIMSLLIFGIIPFMFKKENGLGWL